MGSTLTLLNKMQGLLLQQPNHKTPKRPGGMDYTF